MITTDIFFKYLILFLNNDSIPFIRLKKFKGGSRDMRIENSAIALSSRQSAIKKHTSEERLKFWIGSQGPGFEDSNPTAGSKSGGTFILEISEQARVILSQKKEAAKAVSNETVFEISEEDKLKIKLLEKLLEYLTGKKIKIKVLTGFAPDGDCTNTAAPTENIRPREPQARQGWGLEYEYRETYYEQEKMSFSADGIIKTADGKEICFSVQLSMSREFYTENVLSIRVGDAVKADPLIINFGGTAAQLTSRKFSFDIDSDGDAEQISFAAPGSGFFALDLNGDNVVNNGTEIFGPTTGDGFSELAQYDADGNNWIDENDPVFERLRIWTKDAEGRDTLFALGQKGIGAIFLGSADSPFSIKNRGNKTEGDVKSTGIYVSEKGAVGTIQQVDLTV